MGIPGLDHCVHTPVLLTIKPVCTQWVSTGLFTRADDHVTFVFGNIVSQLMAAPMF